MGAWDRCWYHHEAASVSRGSSLVPWDHSWITVIVAGTMRPLLGPWDRRWYHEVLPGIVDGTMMSCLGPCDGR